MKGTTVIANKFSLNREMNIRINGSLMGLPSGWFDDDFHFMRDATWHISTLVVEASGNGASKIDQQLMKQQVKLLIRKECGYSTVMWLISWVVWSYRVTEWIRLAVDILKEIEDRDAIN